jgi:hypothetical protein
MGKMRIALIGDVGGHVDELRAELAWLGADEEGALPQDLTVIQVGDLVHRGPDSDGVIALVDRYIQAYPDRWIQLLGNHEAIYLRAPAFPWSDRLRTRSKRTLRRWWKDGNAVAAVAVQVADESFLVTHAGVTAAFWSDLLGAPATAEEAAERINKLAAANDAAVFRPGCLLTGRVNPYAGPLWADCARELVPGWLDRQMPFSQIHGHSMMTNWREPHRPPESTLLAVVSIDVTAKHETVWIDGGRLIGIDPGHLAEPMTPWRALELDGVVSTRG